jgi:glycolate oxidase FAD binding subunit
VTAGALRPASAEEAAAALAEATAARATVRLVGGGTRLRAGLPLPADRVLKTASLRRVVAHEPADLTATVEAGLPALELAALLAERGQCWPQADLRPGSTVGGVLAAAASGRGRLRYGPVRDSLLEVVLATGDGRLVKGGGRTVKGVAGYDIPRLAVGARGTLGLIVQVTLKLWPLPPARGWFAAEGPLSARWELAGAALRGDLLPAAVVLSPGAVHVELAGPEEDVAAPAGMAPAAAPPAPAWPATARAGVHPPALPRALEALERDGIPYEALAGVGAVRAGIEDAAALARVRAIARDAGGHAVVEDGPDELRADPWGPAPPGLAAMRRLRAAFDPAGILNPGEFVGEAAAA